MIARRTKRARRGLSAVVMVAVLLLVGLAIMGVVISGSRHQDLTVHRVDTVRAFYAAEAGANMAIRELVEDTDEDGDGTVGTISDDGNAVNDPALGVARLVVTQSVSGAETTLTSTGRAGGARREIETVLE